MNEQEKFKVWSVGLNNSTKLCILLLNISVKYAKINNIDGGG